jgi:hypothetical protein
VQQQFAWIALVAGAGIAMAASWWRSGTEPGSGARSASYLLNVAAILVLLTSVVFEARVANLLGDFTPNQVRRGSLLRLGGGVLIAIAGCAIGVVIANDRVPDGIAAAGIGLLAAGCALILSGLVRIALVDGARYAADKVQERLDDDY